MLSSSPLVGGAPLLPGITVGAVRSYPVSFGDYSRLYDDDRLYPLAIGQHIPDVVESAVCAYIPLHLIVLFVPSSMCVPLSACLPGEALDEPTAEDIVWVGRWMGHYGMEPAEVSYLRYLKNPFDCGIRSQPSRTVSMLPLNGLGQGRPHTNAFYFPLSRSPTWF